MKSKVSLAIYSVNPVQYQAPIFKELHQDSNIKTTVLFGSDIGSKSFYSHELQTTINWDIPLLEGYRYKFFVNLATDGMRGSFSRINPGIFFHIIAKKYDVVLIHGYDTVSSWIVLFAAKIIKAKVIWRGEAAIRPKTHQNIIKKIIKTKVLPKYFKHIDAVMFSCTGNKKYLEQFNIDRNKLFLMPCAVDNIFFRKRRLSPNEIDQYRKKLNISSDHFVILFSSRFTQRKRPLDLINAVSLIDHSKIILLFVGDGLVKKDMVKLSKSKNIKTIFTGFKGQKELPFYYSISDMYVILSEYDASPKSLNEALNFELPVLTTDKVGTAFDLVNDNHNGFIVKSLDIASIAEKINFLNENRDVAIRMGKKSLPISNNWSISDDIIGIKKAINYVMECK